jgi:N-ethylmaleimide reductase
MMGFSDLFLPVRLGRYALANRVVMAPLTRSRAESTGVPRPYLMTIYYEQRASAGLIIAEGTNISPQARGYAYTPGIYNQDQINGWQTVTEGVHQKGGRIFVQLWHVGRISHPSLQPGNALPVSASAIRPDTNAFTEEGFLPCVTPRPLETHEIPGIVEQYRHAAQCALAAGFDGVEIHAANGYLIEQFLRDSTNQRTDDYGGSRENRARLLLEVTEAVARTCGGDRVGIRLSPVTPVNDIGQDSDARGTYGYVVAKINDLGLAYIHVIEGATQGPRDLVKFDYDALRHGFRGFYIANNGYDREMALSARRSNHADLIAFGRAFIANPDLVERLRIDAALNMPHRETFFGGGGEGYIDYPFLKPAQRGSATGTP